MRGDPAAAAKLFRRAVDLATDTRARAALLLDLSEVLSITDRWVEAQRACQEGGALAAEAGDPPLQWRARVVDAAQRLWSDSRYDFAEAERTAAEAAAFFAGIGDDQGLILAHDLQATVHLGRLEWSKAMEVNRRAWELATQLGDNARAETQLRAIVMNAAWGPTPVDELLAIAEAALPRLSAMGRAHVLAFAALGRALRGELVGAREDIARAREVLRELMGSEEPPMFTAGWVELVGGDWALAESTLAATSAAFGAMGETGARSTIVALQAYARFELGRPDADVLELLDLARRMGSADDATTTAVVALVEALRGARAGRVQDAERAIETATAVLAPGDFLHLQGIGRRDRARIGHLRGADAEAADDLGAALRLFSAKGALAEVPRTQRLADAMAAEAAAGGARSLLPLEPHPGAAPRP
jgi:hypothetical protein